jgi:hypothetical protein
MCSGVCENLTCAQAGGDVHNATAKRSASRIRGTRDAREVIGIISNPWPKQTVGERTADVKLGGGEFGIQPSAFSIRVMLAA